MTAHLRPPSISPPSESRARSEPRATRTSPPSHAVRALSFVNVSESGPLPPRTGGGYARGRAARRPPRLLGLHAAAAPWTRVCPRSHYKIRVCFDLHCHWGPRHLTPHHRSSPRRRQTDRAETETATQSSVVKRASLAAWGYVVEVRVACPPAGSLASPSGQSRRAVTPSADALSHSL